MMAGLLGAAAVCQALSGVIGNCGSCRGLRSCRKLSVRLLGAGWLRSGLSAELFGWP